jgi:prepilin-type N-terminal cleavage/methylation domain-containing protein/prepilin-type processing-associated H-X9-DG protein
MKRRAFTLVELLVVVGVLAIVAAILFPIFARSRDGHRPNGCQNNLKQIALGFKQYLNDNNERYPLVLVTSSSKNGAPPYGWADALQPYIRNTQVYQCPSDTYEGNDDPTQTGYTDYWYNANFVRRFVTKKGTIIWTGANESMLGSVAQTILAGEGGNTDGKPTGDARYNICGDGTSLTKSNQACATSPVGYATFPSAQIHLDGANFAYADGHVKWLRGNNPTQSAGVLSNGMTQKTISADPHAGKATFSLLTK